MEFVNRLFEIINNNLMFILIGWGVTVVGLFLFKLLIERHNDKKNELINQYITCMYPRQMVHRKQVSYKTRMKRLNKWLNDNGYDPLD